MATQPFREGPPNASMAAHPPSLLEGGRLRHMAAQMGRLLEKAASEVPIDLDQLIQFMPLIVRQKLLVDMVAAKIEAKITLPWLIAHRNMRGRSAIHKEFWMDVAEREQRNADEEDEDSMELAFEMAFQAAMDAEPNEDRESDRNTIFRQVLKEELGEAPH